MRCTLMRLQKHGICLGDDIDKCQAKRAAYTAARMTAANEAAAGCAARTSPLVCSSSCSPAATANACVPIFCCSASPPGPLSPEKATMVAIALPDEAEDGSALEA